MRPRVTCTPQNLLKIACAAVCGGLLAAGAACRRAPAESANAGSASGPARGGTLVASLRSEPSTFNRYVEASAANDALTILTHATLVRINRVTDQLEPWLAER